MLYVMLVKLIIW